MAKYTLPQSVIIFEFLAQHLDKMPSIMRPQSDTFIQFCKALRDPNSLDKNTHLINCPESIQFLQTLCLIGLTIYNKQFDNQFLSVSYKGSQITIVWKNKITTTINLSKFDTKFRYFLQEYNKNITPLVTSTSNLKETSHWLEKTIKSHLDHVQDSIDYIDNILQSSSNKKIPLPKDNEALFLLISCLPNTDLNLFYRKINQLIQTDLHIETPLGNALNIKDFMDISAKNFEFNFEKFKVHFNIGLSSSDNEIRTSIQAYTKKVLEPLLEKPSITTSIRNELNDTQNNHLLLCHRFYSTFLSHLRMMIHDKTHLS